MIQDASITVQYCGISLEVEGDYDTDAGQFVRGVMIKHKGEDVSVWFDFQDDETIIDKADAAYAAWLKEHAREMREGE
jgi:hypothetical protein